MDNKELMMICLTIIICIAVVCTTIFMVFDGKHIKINTDNNTTNNSTTVANNTSITNNTSVSNTTKSSATTTTHKNTNNASRGYSYGDVVKSYTNSDGHEIIEYYGTGDDTPGVTIYDKTTGQYVDFETWE